MPRQRLIPLIVAVALFMENMDSTIIATSLPAIATDIGTSPIALKLALTSYLLSLAIFIPISGWMADRFGARSVFRLAICVFIAGSIACGFANSLGDFVLARILQGLGGAMMTPVGRLVLLRSVEKRDLVDALAWLTVPALIGPVVGPPVGGFITTYTHWRYIFFINVPIGLLGVLLVTRFIPEIRAPEPDRLDFKGFVLSGIGCSGLIFGFSTLSIEAVPKLLSAVLIVVGGIAGFAYAQHARKVAQPLIDFRLLRLATFRASVLGGSLFRIGIGAVPFLLPLMLQIGFGLSPFQSGLLTFAASAGAMFMKMLAGPILRRFGFRRVLVANALIGSAFIAVNGLFTAATPHLVILAVVFLGGLFRSLQFTSINAMAYADVDEARMSRATSFASAMQQVSLSIGVSIGAGALELALLTRGDAALVPADFSIAFVAVAAVSAISVFAFARLPADAGAALAGRDEVLEVATPQGPTAPMPSGEQITTVAAATKPSRP